MNVSKKTLGNFHGQNQRFKKLFVCIIFLLLIISSTFYFKYGPVNASASGTKFLTSDGSNAGSAAIATNTYNNTTTATANNNYFALRENADSNTGLTWNFTGWTPLNTSTEANGSKVTKVSVFMDAGVGNSGWTSNGNKTFRFRLYNFSNSTYDLLTTAARQLTSRTYAVFTLDFPSTQDYASYFDTNGNFRIQLENTSDGDTFATYLRIEYLYVQIYYDKTAPNVSWSNPNGNPTPYYTKTASISLQANGDDNTATDTETSGVSNMNFYYNNGTETLIGIDTAMDSGNFITGGTWSYAWSPADGLYSVYARSSDGKNNISGNSATQTIIVDRTAPTTSVAAPVSGSRISGNSFAITGTATDANFDYFKVEYSPAGANSWTQIGVNHNVAVSNGTLVNWNTSSVTDGNYDIRLTVYDKATNTQTALVSGVTVDNLGPTFSLQYYSDAALTQALRVSAGKAYTKAGNVYVKLVPNETLKNNTGDNQITIDAPGTASDVTGGNFIWNGSAWVYTWAVAGESDGDTAFISVKATDLAGNVSTGSPASGGTATIDNTPPNLSFQYYYDPALTSPVPVMGGKPQVRAGTIYVKLVSDDPLSSLMGDHQLYIDAPGTLNDVNNQNFSWDTTINIWKYAWVINNGNDGDTLSVTVSAKNIVGLVTVGTPNSGNLVTVQTEPAATNLILTANPTSVLNDNVATSTINAHLIDQYGTALSGRQIDFSTSLGTLSSANATTDANGDAAVAIRSGILGTAAITGTLNGTALARTTTVQFRVPDNTVPVFTKAEASGKQIVYLTFSEPIEDPNTAGSTISISGGLIIAQISMTGDGSMLKLVLSNSQGTGNQSTPLTYTVSVQNIKDLAGNNLLSANQNFTAFTPHGNYATDTGMCRQCHSAHTAKGQELLADSLTITKACFVCHGATGTSVYKVEGEFTSRTANGSTVSYSLHKALDYDSPGNDVLYCSDCHNPHGNSPSSGTGAYPKLLRSTLGTTEYYQGNNFCLACHGSGANPRFSSFYASTGGNHSNANAVHYDASIQGGLLLPASGTQITCLKCHEKHGSRYGPLIENSLDNSEEKLCFKCHGDNTANNLESGQAIKQNIYRQFNTAAAPGIPTLSSQSTTGGSLAGGATYYFKVTAAASNTRYSSDYIKPIGIGQPDSKVTPMLESLPSEEFVVQVPAGTNTNSITLALPQYTGASGYDKFNVYMNFRLNAPDFTLSAYTPTVGSTNVRLTPGAYKVRISAFGPFGETFPSPTAKTVTTATGQGIRVTISNTGAAWPNITGYQKANYFKVYAAPTSGTEKLIGTILQNPARLPSVKDFFDNISPIINAIGAEPVPDLASPDAETFQGTVNAAVTGNTTFAQSAAPLTRYPVPKGSEHEVDPTRQTRAGSKIECSSCHGPHTSDNVSYMANQSTSAVSDPANTMKYWVTTGTGDSSKTVGTMTQWCLQCHSATANISKTLSATVRVPYTMGWPNINFTNNSSGWFKDNVYLTSDHGSPSKGNYDCTTCHDQHGSREHLLLKTPYDGFDFEGNCLRCHNGTTSAKNIKAAFSKAARHPSLDSGFGGHEIDEDYNALYMAPRSNRHAECEDCHDPHSVNDTTASAPNAAGSIKNVTGVGFTASDAASRPPWTQLAYNSPIYQFKRPITYEYELCYKCHSTYSFDSVYPTSTSGAMETDIAMQFNPNNPSHHAVEGAGKNTAIPNSSFNVVNGVQMTAATRLYCFDCHGDDDTVNPIRGPHGSNNKFLLKKPYDNGEWSGAKKNDLCLMCHSTNVYNNSANSSSTGTRFTDGSKNLHNDHISQIGSTQYFCGDCHGLYVHGQQRPHLITLNTDPYPYGQWSVLKNWVDPGAGNYTRSSCSVTVPPGQTFNSSCGTEHP